MELIKVENGVSLLSPEVSKQIAELETKAKEIKAAEEALKEAIKAEMESKGIIKLDTPELAITYVQPTYSERFDSKSLKADDEELYNRYIKISNVASSIRIKVK